MTVAVDDAQAKASVQGSLLSTTNSDSRSSSKSVPETDSVTNESVAGGCTGCAQEYQSCFYVPPPPPGKGRIYHNRKRTAYTEFTLDANQAVPMTVLRLLATETDPTHGRVKQVAYAEGDAHEDSNLIDAIQTPCKRGWMPLLMAAQRGQTSAASALLELGAEPDCRDPQGGWTPLMYAVANGDKAMAELLLASGASVNAFAVPSDFNPLCVAIMSSRTDFVTLLLDAGADLGLIRRRHPGLAEVYTAACPSACSPRKHQPQQQQQQEMPKLWPCPLSEPVKHKSSVRTSSKKPCNQAGTLPPLLQALQDRHAAEALESIRQGAEIECEDPQSGWTPLMYAAATGDSLVLGELLKRGACPNTVAPQTGWSALCVAVLNGRWDIVQLMLDKGGDIELLRRRHPEAVDAYTAEVSATGLA